MLGLGARLFGGTAPWSALGVIFIVIGALFFVSIILSPKGWEWWMHSQAIHGMERDGIIYYTYRGENYSIDDPSSMRTGPRTVWVIPSDPADAAVHGAPTIVLDWLVTLGPAATGVVCFGVGFAMKRRKTRENEAFAQDGFGCGLGATLDQVVDEEHDRERSGRGLGDT